VRLVPPSAMCVVRVGRGGEHARRYGQRSRKDEAKPLHFVARAGTPLATAGSTAEPPARSETQLTAGARCQ